MGFLLSITIGILSSITMGFLLSIVLGIQLTIYSPAPFGIVSAHEDDDVVRKPMIVYGLVFPSRCLVANPVEVPVHLVQIDIGCQWAERPSLRNTYLAPCLQYQFHKAEHIRVLYPSCDLLQQDRVPDRVKVAL